jgi:hypothetical protein
MAIKISRAMVIIAAFIIVVLTIFGLTVYYMFFYERIPVKYIAAQFCECADKPEVQKSRFELNKEDFQYAGGLNECFGADFSYYDDALTFEEEEMYVEQVRKEIFETCPHLFEKVFKQ